VRKVSKSLALILFSRPTQDCSRTLSVYPRSATNIQCCSESPLRGGRFASFGSGRNSLFDILRYAYDDATSRYTSRGHRVEAGHERPPERSISSQNATQVSVLFFLLHSKLRRRCYRSVRHVQSFPSSARPFAFRLCDLRQ